MEKPKLLIIAGPNGSGKTTFTKLLLGHYWSADCLFINPDEIAQNEFGDWNSQESVIKAANRAKELREQCLFDKKSMVVETVLSTEEKIIFIRRAKEAGFFVRVFFIGTDSPEINASRVVRRVMEGGHEVPINKIIKRYFSSMQMCVYAAALADRLYVNDNSVDGLPPELIFRTRDGRLYKKYPGISKHDWAIEIFKQLRGRRV
ncbi:MAG: zeta toxin family protein [Deltaproteobacteria bacterium]|jgi:predicted ABC-type ATPase|nr:zeta toxin family protein [Deltaproteobacteria bacterium]